jgi:Domain of unknown function (DUF4397)
MKRFAAILLTLSTAVLIMNSCEKNSFKVRDMTYPENQAFVKVGLFTAYNTNQPIRVQINGETVSNELLYPISFPGGGLNMNGSLNSDYLMITPGNAKVELYVMNQGTPKPISKLHESNVPLEAGKRYTLFLTDTAQNIAAFAVNDDTNAPDSGFARLKFVNGMPNVPALDLYKGSSVATATLIAGNVAYKGASDYVNVPAGSDSFYIRPAGSPATSTPIVRRLFALSNQRIYTILSRGYNGATGNRIPHLSAIVNQ